MLENVPWPLQLSDDLPNYFKWYPAIPITYTGDIAVLSSRIKAIYELQQHKISEQEFVLRMSISGMTLEEIKLLIGFYSK